MKAKRLFKILTVAQLAFQAYNYYMESKRNKEVKKLKKEVKKERLNP